MIRSIVASVAVFLVTPSVAETITVCASGCDYTSINAAIEAAGDGDVIQLGAETYFEGTPINVGKPVTLRGIRDKSGSLVSVLDGSKLHRVLSAGSGAIVEDLVIQHGVADRGAGMRLTDATARQCIVRSNTSYSPNWAGAGVYASGDVVLDHCRIEDNFVNSAYGGGLLVDGGTALVVWCRFVGNHANHGGGAYTQHADVRFQSCTFEENTAWTQGAALDQFLGHQELAFCLFRQNGGGWQDDYAWQTSYSSTAEACYFLDNYCGAVRGTSSLVGCDFAGNAGLDVAAYTSTPVRVEECVFDRCCSVSPIAGVVDAGGNSFAGLPFPACETCRPNIDCKNDAIGAGDLGLLLTRWGTSDLQCDIDGDGVVSAGDLGLLMVAWGPCG